MERRGVMGMAKPKPTNGPYGWGNGPQPKTGLIGRLIELAVTGKKQPKSKKKK
jgi:hypothetical protein